MRSICIAAALVIAILLLLPGSGRAQDERHYTVLMMGNPAGSETAIMRPDGTREFTFEFNDRGRGPKVSSLLKVDSNGIMSELRTTGVDYYKVPVDENLTRTGGVSRWKSTSESGERETTKAFFVSINGAPEELALLVQAILRSPDKRVALLPAGNATVQKAGDLTLASGDKKRHITLYEVSGLSFTPQPIWLDDDGTFFGSVSRWLSAVRAGWESGVSVLIEKQDDIERARTAALVPSLVRRPTGPVVLTHVRLFDPERAVTEPDVSVVVEGERIKAVGKNIPLPPGADVIDGRGKTLLPGLWDMHVHMQPGDGLLHLAAGVTSVRDMGNDLDSMAALKSNIEGGREIGPRIITAGLIDGRGPFAGPTKLLVDTEEEGRAIIDDLTKRGYPQLKIYSSIKPDLVPKLIAYAHLKGMRVSGHVPAFMTAEQFVLAGADEFQHINFFALNFLDDVKDTRSTTRFTAVADRAATIDLNSEKMRAFLKLLSDRKIVVDPTVNVFEGMFTDRPGTMSASYAAVAERLPPQIARGFTSGGLPVPEGKDQRYKDSFRACLKMVKLLYDAGVPIVAGTDAFAGFALHRELELYVEAGIPPGQVLRVATIGAARVMKKDGDLGSVSPGKLADLILVDGDPTMNISDIRRTVLVMKGGSIYQPTVLYKSIGVRP